jgi:AcrR family transcriptional regulator
MARPREFNEDQVLNQVTALFRQRGYDGTSVTDLEEASGMGRASLYGAFGDKRALFLAALSRYVEQGGVIDTLLDEAPSLHAAMIVLCDAWIASNTGPVPGCFALQSAMGCPLDEAKTLLRQNEARITEGLLRAMQRAHKANEISATAAMRENVAQLFIVSLQGVSSAARTGRSRDDLTDITRTLIDATLRMLGAA